MANLYFDPEDFGTRLKRNGHTKILLKTLLISCFGVIIVDSDLSNVLAKTVLCTIRDLKICWLDFKKRDNKVYLQIEV